jgi:actin-like ATPase involved in cell morphogenesis
MSNKVKSELKNKDDIICIGLDVGTMNIVCARSDSDEVKMTRNVFLPLDNNDIQISELSEINYIQDEDGKLFIIGSDAFKYANIFGQKVSRPMEKGLISPKEISAIDVLTLMIKDLFGDIAGKETYCNFSIPAESIDEGRTVIYHENVFARILKSLGINYTSVNEAMSIIYSECAQEKFSGIGISFGAGMVNCCLSFKGIEALKFSTARSGDWIDNETAASLGMVANRVTSIKEKYMQLSGEVEIKNKKTKRVLEALYYYHKALIDYTVKKIIEEFNDKVDIEIDEPVPIIISGGTSIPRGFVELFKHVVSGYDLPFEVSEIRRAKNPLTAVANGLLIKTLSDVKRMN